MTTPTKQNIVATDTENAKYIIRFKTTPKASKEYKYQEHQWDISSQLDIHEYLKETKIPFKKGGWIKKNDKRTSGYDICVNEEFKGVSNLVYLIVCENKILKGGKSKNPLPERTYGAGTEENWTIKGSPSETNYVWSQIFRQCLVDGRNIEFYIFNVPTKIEPFPTSEGEPEYEEVSHYEAVEKNVNNHLTKTLGRKVIGEGDLLKQNKN